MEYGWIDSLPFSPPPVCTWHKRFLRLGCNTGHAPALQDCVSYVEFVTHHECSVNAGPLLAVFSPKSWTLSRVDIAEPGGEQGWHSRRVVQLDQQLGAGLSLCTQGTGRPLAGSKGLLQLQTEASSIVAVPPFLRRNPQ